MWFFRRRLPYKTIDVETDRAILALHRQHEEMGRKRLHALLASQGINVDEHELKTFLREHRIGVPQSRGQVPPAWGESRTPQIPWLKHRR